MTLARGLLLGQGAYYAASGLWPVLNIRSSRMLLAHGFLHRIFEIFDRYNTSVDMVSTSEVSVSLTLDNSEHLEEICDEICRRGR